MARMKSLTDRACCQELRSRLVMVRADTPRRWGRVNAAQMICHLNDSFLGIIGEKPMEVPRGLSLWPVLKYVALYAPMQWPKSVPTRPEFDQLAGGGTPPAQFEADMRSLL